jgi:nucleoside-diphosphate-sugar epimerase
LCTAGTQVRDFMYVDDVADAFVTLLTSGVEGAVNIATGRPVRIADVVTTIARQLNALHLVRLGARPIPAGEPPFITAVTTRLREEVGCAAARDLEVGLAQTIEWWKSRAPYGKAGTGA